MTRPLFVGKARKYRNVPWEYRGVKYHSKAEAAHAALLDVLKSAPDPSQRVLEWGRQIDVPLTVNGTHICNYRVDFWVRYADGRMEWVEVKGMDTPIGERNIKHFRAQYPERTLTVIR